MSFRANNGQYTMMALIRLSNGKLHSKYSLLDQRTNASKGIIIASKSMESGYSFGLGRYELKHI